MSRSVVIVLLVALVLLCVLPICVSVIYTAANAADPALAQTLVGLGIALFCVIGIGGSILAVIVGAWQGIRARSAAARLAQAMGLQPLNKANHVLKTHYGGDHAGRAFAIRVVPEIRRNLAGTYRSFRVKYQLQVAMALNLPEPQQVWVETTPGPTPQQESFAELFHLENGGRLNASAQTALIDFIKGVKPMDGQSAPVRPGKGRRHILLCDRTALPDDSIAPEVLSDAKVVVVYQHAKPLISAEQLRTILDDMAVLATALENALQ